MSTIKAYSYVRFSHPEQAKGDSLRRQTELASAYCAKRGWALSEATYRDLGVSAFRGKNALVGNLGEFLKAVKGGGVKPGEALIVESLDRITRQGIDEGYDLIKSILKSGVLLVTLSPEREFDVSATKSLSKGALEIQLILERAAEESEMKSKRVSAAWRAKQQKARETGKPLTRALPEWLTMAGDKIILIPERAAAVRRMFELASSGYGFGLIVKALTDEKIPPFRGTKWLKQYVAEIVSDRRCLGEYQPRKGRKPDGEPIPGYYPAVVDEDTWNRARAGALDRRKRRGRVGNHVNIFAGLLHNALDGDTYMATSRYSGKRPGHPGTLNRVLVTTAYSHGRGESRSFPFPDFEQAVCALLKEIHPHEILNGDSEDGPDEIENLTRQLGVVEARIALISAEMDKHGESVTLIGRLRVHEANQKDLVARLHEARQKATSPLSEAWSEARGLLDVLDAGDGRDARLRLRAQLRRIVAGVYLLVVPRGRARFCACQLWFHRGKVEKRQRSILIYSRPPVANQNARKPGGWQALSFASGGVPSIDLRKPADAKLLEKALAVMPLPVDKK